MFCRYCGEPEGQCGSTCHGATLGAQQTIRDQLDRMLLSKSAAENSRRRNGSSRTKVVNPSTTPVNVTAYPATMDPDARKPVKLEKGSPVNIVFMLDASYTEVLNGVQDCLFLYPAWALADYRLATADGAIILPDTPFSRFPFNLGSKGGKKALWLVRIEGDTGNSLYTQEVNPDEVAYLGSEIGEQDVHTGRCLSPQGFGNCGTEAPSISSNAFGVVAGGNNPCFEDVYDHAKGNSGSIDNSVAILRQYDVSCNPPRWSECLLSSLHPPNMADPVTDGMCKDVFRDALFKPVFGNDKVVFKVARQESHDNLCMHKRAVQNMALAAAIAAEFNARVPDKKYQIKFCDSVVVELLSESIDIKCAPSDSLHEMLQKGAIWVVERQLKSSRCFQKYVSNTGEIVAVEECTTDRPKLDRMIATAFAHWSYERSQGQCMFLDLQGSRGEFVDVEIVTTANSKSLFGIGNLGLSSIKHFFQQHECNFVCQCFELRPGHEHESDISATPTEITQTVSAKSSDHDTKDDHENPELSHDNNGIGQSIPDHDGGEIPETIGAPSGNDAHDSESVEGGESLNHTRSNPTASRKRKRCLGLTILKSKIRADHATNALTTQIRRRVTRRTRN